MDCDRLEERNETTQSIGCIACLDGHVDIICPALCISFRLNGHLAKSLTFVYQIVYRERERQAKVRDREKIMCVRTDRQTAIWKMFANFRHKYNLVDLNTHLKEKLYTNTYKKNSLQQRKIHVWLYMEQIDTGYVCNIIIHGSIDTEVYTQYFLDRTENSNSNSNNKNLTTKQIHTHTRCRLQILLFNF